MADIQKTLTQIAGVVLTLIGIIGFFIGDSLIGFGINTLHNIIHLLTGAIGLWAGFGKSVKNAIGYNEWAGITYIVLAVLGFVIPAQMEILFNINMADNLFHLVLGVVLSGVGFGVKSGNIK